MNCFGPVLVLILACRLPAQTGEISGLVKDSSGASVPKAAIRIQNTDTGAKAETVSNQEGFYALPFLKGGPYEITVEANLEPPCTDPYARWYGRGRRVTAAPMPIKKH
jgi:hypothetical protein